MHGQHNVKIFIRIKQCLYPIKFPAWRINYSSNHKAYFYLPIPYNTTHYKPL